MTEETHYSLDRYAEETPPAVFLLLGKPQFSPLDINVAYLNQSGWNQTVDRLRFHVSNQTPSGSNNPIADAITSIPPQLLIRRLNDEDDLFVSVQISTDGTVTVMSNDSVHALDVFTRLLLDCPPSFHSLDEFEVKQQWNHDSQPVAYFTGMLSGARGWDPSHNIPENIRQSLEEAHRSLESANYRSTAVMSRRTLEAVLKYGFTRLLHRPPENARGRPLMLNDMIVAFRNESTKPIPDHLLHIADSVRLVGNVPGAHAAEIQNYQFSRSDAEYALYAVSHFLHEYFNKIDKDVSQYYTITIDMSDSQGTTE